MVLNSDCQGLHNVFSWELNILKLLFVEEVGGTNFHGLIFLWVREDFCEFQMRNLLISMFTNFLFWWTKQIFFLVIKLEPLILSWLQPRKSNCVPTELDTDFDFCWYSYLVNVGSKISSKIKIYILSSAELLYSVCNEIPCTV